MTGPVADAASAVLNPAQSRARQVFKEATLLLRPLPPFRAKPSRRDVAPKPQSENRKTVSETVVKARRHPVKLARLNAAPQLKVLGRDTSPTV
jgi:hypothetical protein